MKTAFFAALLLLIAGLFTAGLSCGGATDDPSDASHSADAGVDRARLSAPVQLGGPCNAVEDSPPLLPANHVAIGTVVDYDSNPPSSGPHYPIWAAYQAYTIPVDRRYYVHDLEHGAIDLVYNCNATDGGADDSGDSSDDGGSQNEAGPCPEVAAQLQAIIDAYPSDPKCDPANGDPRVRFVLTPDPLLDVPVAAAAWGWTYKAQCVDPATLVQFAKDHYGQGPEQICANGQAQF